MRSSWSRFTAAAWTCTNQPVLSVIVDIGSKIGLLRRQCGHLGLPRRQAVVRQSRKLLPPSLFEEKSVLRTAAAPRFFCNHHTQGTAPSLTELTIEPHRRIHSGAAPPLSGYAFALGPVDRDPDRRQDILCRCLEDREQPTVPRPFHCQHKQLQK